MRIAQPLDDLSLVGLGEGVVQQGHLNAHRVVGVLEFAESGDGSTTHEENACPVFAAREQFGGLGGDGLIGCSAVVRLWWRKQHGMNRFVEAFVQCAAQGVVVLEGAGDALSVAPSGRCRQQQRASGVEVIKHRPPCLCRGVVRLIDHDQVEEVPWRKSTLLIVSRADRVRESDDHIIGLKRYPVGGASRHLKDAWRTDRFPEDPKSVELPIRRELLRELSAYVASRGEDQDPAGWIYAEERRGHPNCRLACASRDADHRRLSISQAPVSHRRTQRADLGTTPTSCPITKKSDVLRGSPVEARLCHLRLRRAGAKSLLITSHLTPSPTRPRTLTTAPVRAEQQLAFAFRGGKKRVKAHRR